jgi:DNA-binding transcriptional ArsR family regulator
LCIDGNEEENVPRLTPAIEKETDAIQFVASPSLDMMNLMYFTSLVPEMEGVEGWPVRLRQEMAPELLKELDFLYNYPAGDPGLMGTLGDNLFAHPETWRSVDALVAYVEGIPDGTGNPERWPGIQGLIFQTTFRYPDDVDRAHYDMPQREAIEKRLRSFDDRDADAIMPYYDRPGELRARMVVLIRRFYAEHYEKEMANRLPALERSVAMHRAEGLTDAEEIARRLQRRTKSCLEVACSDWEVPLFAPSMDMGVYNSCAIVDGVHGMFYQLEPEFLGAPVDVEETRLARIYKALADEQRLRILRLLRDGEMYAQEIVEATGIHQSVVSRHLTFMKAVGLVNARRQNNMKFFSINQGIRDELAGTLDLLAPPLESTRQGEEDDRAGTAILRK